MTPERAWQQVCDQLKNELLNQIVHAAAVTPPASLRDASEGPPFQVCDNESQRPQLSRRGDL